MKRALALLCAALLLLTGCELEGETPSPSPSPSDTPPVMSTPSPSPARREPFALAWDPGDTLDPIEAGAANRELSPLVFEGLFALDGAFAAQPVLCETYVQAEDGLSWSFTLREGVTFSDGTQLTAAHVAASLNRARSSSIYGARLAQIEAVTAGEGTVSVTLSTPNGGLPALLDIPVARAGEDGGPPLGTGPYCFDSSGEAPCLRLRSDWRGEERLPLETILLREVSTPDRRIAAFDTGEITLVDLDPTGTNALGYSGQYESWEYPTAVMLYLGFQTQSGPCEDAVLRRAISRVLDREELAATFFEGYADPSALPVPPGSALYDARLAAEQCCSVEEAAALLAEEGYTLNDEDKLLRRRKQVALTLAVNSENGFRTAAADRLAQTLGELGIAVTVNRLTWENYLKALEKGEFDLYLGQIKLTADFDLTALLAGELNYGGFDSEEAADLLAQFRSASGADRKQAAAALYTQLAQEPPFTALCFMRNCVLTRWGSVSGLSPIQGNIFYRMERWTVSAGRAG